MKKYYPELFLFPIFFALVMVATLPSVSAQTTPYTPEKGSAERKAILDGIRKYRKSPNEVYAPTGFKAQNGWVFVSAPDPNDPDVDTLAFDLLLQKVGKIWKVVAEVSHTEGSDYNKEIKRIRKKFPKASAEILK